ncbi:MAG: helix-turn-helix domain-containing protein [Holosporaceae bacterium]|nr:helix-turn-helix domain-containing protein [Holosporaceae bacterium]
MDFRKKKSLFDDQDVVHTVAQLKGRRLRMARALTGFSRQELYEKIGIATSTIDTWESGRVELTGRSAIRVCEAFKQVGIYCTDEWLLTGMGDPPRLMRDVEKSFFMSSNEDWGSEKSEIKQPKELKILPFGDEDVRKELSFFVSLHKNVLYHMVEKDFMNLRYRKGDCVAGKIDDLKNLEGCSIIAKMPDEKTILCELLHYSNGKCEIMVAEYDSAQNDVEIAKAAEIVWHRMPLKVRRVEN